jgi:hypothetical protein
MVHIRQEGIKFHTAEEFFPNQFHHPKRSSMTLFESTQSIQKILKKTPDLSNHPTMEKQVVHSLLSILTHTAPVCNHITTFHQVVTSKNPNPSCRPNKESNPPRSFDSPYTLPREAHLYRGVKSMVERVRIKSTFPVQLPNQFIHILPPSDMRMKKIRESQHLIQLPIIQASLKNYIPFTETTITLRN